MVASWRMSVWSRLTASDPGLLRLLLAARGTLAVLLTTVAAVMLAGRIGEPVLLFASGVLYATMAPFVMREPSRRERQVTLLILVLPAVAVTMATAFMYQRAMLGEAFFLVLVFVCFLLQARGSRAIGIGLMAVIICYVDLYLDLAPATLPVQLLSIAVAIPTTAVASFVLLPLRPAATLRRAVRAVQRRAAQVLREAQTAQRTGAVAADRRLWRILAQLNAAALAADDQLAQVNADGRGVVRSELINLEVAVARLVDALEAVSPGPQHVEHLRLSEIQLRLGRWSARDAHTGAAPDDDLHAALAELNRAAAALGAAALAATPSKPSLAPPAPPGPLAWRAAAQATVAAALAMAGGLALSPNRWFWAVITTYVVFLGARSRGDAIFKGVQRLSGTLGGLVGGVSLAFLLNGHATAETVVLLAAVFGMYYLFTTSYTLSIFCVTILLGLLYGLLGADLDALLMLRLEETAVGAAVSVLVAAFVLPARTRDQVRRSGAAVLTALAEAMRCSRHHLAGTPAGSPLEAMRQVDRQVADLRLALLPLTAGRRLFQRGGVERSVPALLACVHWARVLAAASESGAAGDAALLDQAARIERALAELTAFVTDAPSTGFAARPAVAPKTPSTGVVQAALNNLDQALGLLEERLVVGAHSVFRLDA
jgi:uncharacterized membrane protein YgaE (UPF0421/DUF939 family)